MMEPGFDDEAMRAYAAELERKWHEWYLAQCAERWGSDWMPPVSAEPPRWLKSRHDPDIQFDHLRELEEQDGRIRT